MSHEAEEKRKKLWEKGFLEAVRKEHLPPKGVVGVVGVGCAMGLWSFVLVSLPAPFEKSHEQMLWIVNNDMFAIQNLGHGAFLIMFATSWWRNQNVLGLCMCQLSCLFLLFSALGYSLLAAYFSTVASLLHHIVPGLFLSLLAIGLILSTQMAKEWNLSVIHPKVLFLNDEDTTLRRMLYLQCIYQCLEPVLVAAARLREGENNLLIEDLQLYPALSLRGFIESYTLGFHQAFIMATSFSQVLVDDSLKEPSAVLLSMFGQFILVLGFGVGGLMIPADPIFFRGTLFKVGIHFLIFLLLSRLHQRISRIRSTDVKYSAVPQDTAPQEPKSSEQQESSENEHVSVTKSFQGVTVWDIFLHSKDATRRLVATVVFVTALLHGLGWQGQSALSVWLSATSPVAMHRINGFQNGLNFSMHGAGITIMVLVLALRSPVSFPFLKFSILMGAYGGAAISFLQLAHLSGLENAHTREARIVFWFFFLRGLAGILLGISYGFLHYPHVDEIYSPESTVHKISREERRLRRKSTRLGYGVTFVFCVVIFVYALCVTHSLAEAGVRAGFAMPQSEEVDAAMRDRWHEHRLVEFPPGYGLIFHFAFLLPGFVLHYYGQEFQPSRWIGVAFTAGALIVFVSQVLFFMHMADSHLLVYSSAVAAVASLGLMLHLAAHRSVGDKSADFLAADFWH